MLRLPSILSVVHNKKNERQPRTKFLKGYAAKGDQSFRSSEEQSTLLWFYFRRTVTTACWVCFCFFRLGRRKKQRTPSFCFCIERRGRSVVIPCHCKAERSARKFFRSCYTAPAVSARFSLLCKFSMNKSCHSTISKITAQTKFLYKP